MQNATNTETSATVGEELAALLRGMQAGRDLHGEAFAALCRMVEADAKSPRDALALLVSARSLIANKLLPAFPENTEGYVVHLVLALVGRAIEALEAASGETAASFTGDVPVVLN